MSRQYSFDALEYFAREQNRFMGLFDDEKGTELAKRMQAKGLYHRSLFPDQAVAKAAKTSFDNFQLATPEMNAIGQDMRRFYGIDDARVDVNVFGSSSKPGVPTVQGASRAMADNAPRMGISQADASILDDVASGRPSPTPPAAKPSVPVSQVIPDRRPLMTATQPAPAAPRPTAPPTPTKVSTTRAPAGNMARSTALVTDPWAGSATVPRMAGGAVEQSPGFRQMLSELIGGGGTQAKDAVKGVTQGASRANKGVAGLLRGNAGRLVAGTGVLSALAAASEFADTEDPLLRNASQAAGNFGGGLAGAAGGAAIGTAILPGIGTATGALIGGFSGSGLGSNIGGGIYDMINNTSPEERARDQMAKNANAQRSILLDDMKASMLMQKDAMLMKRNDDFARQDRDLQVQNEYNYANMVNQAVINSQANANLQQLAIAQQMMG